MTDQQDQAELFSRYNEPESSLLAAAVVVVELNKLDSESVKPLGGDSIKGEIRITFGYSVTNGELVRRFTRIGSGDYSGILQENIDAAQARLKEKISKTLQRLDLLDLSGKGDSNE